MRMKRERNKEKGMEKSEWNMKGDLRCPGRGDR